MVNKYTLVPIGACIAVAVGVWMFKDAMANEDKKVESRLTAVEVKVDSHTESIKSMSDKIDEIYKATVGHSPPKPE